MTHYHFDNQIQKKTFSRKKIMGVSFAVVVSVGIIIFVLAPIVRTIARGPQWFQNTARETVEMGVTHLTPKKFIIAQNTELRNQGEAYRSQLVELQILRDENSKLREELSYVKNPHEVIIARVIAKPSQSLYNSLIIDQGSRDGVEVGQLVTTQGTIGLGTISTTSLNTATVQLFSGPQFDSNLVLKRQSITVPARGKGGGNFEIHIPREIVVTDGDLLALPEHPNMAVGVVKSIIFDPRDPFQTVLARTPVNIQELNFVEVVK
jgi:cell shape-determining protein MreC